MTFEAAEQIQDCQTIFCVKMKNVIEHIFEKKNAKCFLNFFKNVFSTKNQF